MAQLVLSTVGRAVGGQFGAIGETLGRIAGAALGAQIDQRIFGGVTRSEGPRLTDLHVQASTEGASIPVVFGRVRIAGQVIWAARFKEHSETHGNGGGKGGAPRSKNTSYAYSLSFAVGLCEGKIARIGRVWVNGAAFDLSTCACRLHTGSEDQAIDPLIETIEGADNAPAFRGLAYIVFEDLPLEQFGNVIPQFSFEIVRPAPPQAGEARLEDQVKAVCLIPGSGEFVYATEPVFRDIGPGQQAPENVHAESARANVLVSLDQLAADLPKVETVLLVINWFGDDLRCGVCTIAPRVEIATKATTPVEWSAGGLTRGSARLVSQYNGAPAFGGTPSDASVLQAIAALKARGYKVGIYPMLLMDVPHENVLSDPYGAAAQGAYPWRGRVTLHPAVGQSGSPDKTSAASTQVSAFVGVAAPGDFAVVHGAPHFAGAEWSYRRFILHYAKLAQIAGGVDYFILGSEMRGLTTARDGASSYPFVTALKNVAADVRSMLGAKLTYAADWSEYFGHQPQDSSGDVFFHLDPLWADANIDAIGVDWYPPLTDWRDGAAHLDAEQTRSVYDLDYLEGRIEAGEDFDFFYASDADRVAQVRSAISDGAYGEPWIFRAKDIRNFWSRTHHDRPGGVRAASPTPWVAESKPIWFVEFGCPAIDKGANAPNLFVDGKSSESALPPFSDGARDDLIQRRTLLAYARHWAADSSSNPPSSLTGKPMVEMMSLWCWDARPNPAFPARSDVWADGANWRLGHWVNGRAGLSELGDVVTQLCARADVNNADARALIGAVSGFVLDSPSTARAGIEALAAAFDFVGVDHDGVLTFVPRNAKASGDIGLADLSAGSVAELYATRSDGADVPIEARVRFLDAARDYLLADVSARRLDSARGGVETIEAPLVLEVEAVEALAQAVLADRRAANERLRIELGPAHLALEPGDVVALAGGADAYEIVRIEDTDVRQLELQRVRPRLSPQLRLPEPNAHAAPVAPAPLFAVLDLPPLPGAEDDDRPLVALFASPWLGDHELDAGPSLNLETARARVTQAAVIGELVWALWPGPVDRWDQGNLFRIRLYGGALASAAADAVLNGANAFAIDAGDGEWEIVQAQTCTLVAPGEYELSGLLRGCLGSSHAMQAPHPVGTRIVLLDARLARAGIQSYEWAEPLLFIAPPSGAFSSDPRAAQQTLTLPHAAARPWAPAHVEAARATGGDVTISWIRCARIGGDTWGAGEPPIGAPTEAYLLEIVDGTGAVKRSGTPSSPLYVYSAADQTLDFGALPTSLRIRVAQLGDGAAPGLNTELTITL
ncbi:MAG: glycoside hydrolase/phage tail family protein [Terricaulis sp.]